MCYLCIFVFWWGMKVEQEIDSYLEVFKVIDEVNNLHKAFSLDRINFLDYNLRKNVKTVVDESGINANFLILINKYKTDLNANVTRFIDIQMTFPNLRYRIKQGESISEKLLYYMTQAHQNGEVALNKCLNDLLGFRILVPNLDVIYRCLIIDENLNRVIKIYLREDGQYKGLHIYFKNGNNKFFPWELQVWDINQAEKNESSHKKHKQKRKYISLPQNYHDGNLEKEE